MLLMALQPGMTNNSIKYIPFGCWLKGTTMAFTFLANFLEIHAEE
jgi:hypothetical protein